MPLNDLKCYRLIRAGDSLTMWRSDASGGAKLVATLRCPPDASDERTDEVVELLLHSAEIDHSVLLPWIVVDDGTDVLMTTGPVHEHR